MENEKNTGNTEKAKPLSFKEFMKNPKMVKSLMYGVCAVIMLIFLSELYSSISSPSNPRNSSITHETDGNAVEEHERRLELKLERAVSAVEGVGELTIVVTLDSLSETVYSDRGTQIKTIITPKVRGVAIICEGGDDYVVKQKIVEIVSRVLGINSTKISVAS